MATPTVNIEGTAGGTVRVSAEVQDSDGTIADLTGYTGTMQVRATADSATVLATGTVTIDTTTGVVTGTVAAADTEDATWSRAVYDVRIVNSIGTLVEYVVAGTISLRKAVTQA